MDGRFTPSQNVFWKSSLVNLNGNTYHWIHTTQKNDWVELKPNIHTSNIKLISQFKEIPLKDYDFSVHSHPAHSINDLEQLNVLNDLIGRIQDAGNNPISNLVMSTKKESKITNLFSWTRTLKIIVFVIIGIALASICIKLFIIFNPIPRIISGLRNAINSRFTRKTQDIPLELIAPMLQPTNAPISAHSNIAPTAPDVETVHSHNKCSFVVGKGLVWEDLCPCDPTQL